MSSGLMALLDDVVAIAKVAAASLDDAAAQATKAGAKAAGIVIDDAAVTPRYVVGLTPDRELPIIAKIAWGSLKNKVLFLLPGALLLNYIAPWIIVPLLMIGGLYLCYEGYEKLAEYVFPHAAHADPDDSAGASSAAGPEAARVESAIRTDFILSAEIMAITLAAVATAPFWLQASVLGVVGVGMTALVYGAVALIVKADDAGLALSRRPNAAVAFLGRKIVLGMPYFLKVLSFVGMVAMLWVGGGIIIHGLYELGFGWPEKTFHAFAEAAAHAAGMLEGVIGWAVYAGIAAVIGAVLGGLTAPLAHHVVEPLWKRAGAAFAR
jgi:predicted DNA repair protein MutK